MGQHMVVGQYLDCGRVQLATKGYLGMDRLYIYELYPNLCSTAFVVECAKGRDQLIGSFLEALLVANAYRGELLSLMAIHLILLSINRVHGDFLGSVEVVTDSLGASSESQNSPPTEFRHAANTLVS